MRRYVILELIFFLAVLENDLSMIATREFVTKCPSSQNGFSCFWDYLKTLFQRFFSKIFTLTVT